MTMSDSEKMVKTILSEKYDKVYKLGRDGCNVDTGYEEIKSKIGFPTERGIPDFIAWNSKTDYKFVEVKYSRNKLSKNQTEWLSKRAKNHDVEVWWVEDIPNKNYSISQVSDLIFENVPGSLANAMNWDSETEFDFCVKNSGVIELKQVEQEDGDS